MKIPAGLSPALALTEEWHNDTYPAISPTRPELSAKGKTIVITGGGSGIGAETVRAFALAGAATIAILGRREQLLLDTKSTVEKEFPATKIDTYAADVCNEGDLQRAAKRIGAWDVLVQNAGYMAKRGKIAESDVADWWKAFEVCYPAVDKIVILGTSTELPGPEVNNLLITTVIPARSM